MGLLIPDGKLLVGSLFAGIGGIDLGFIQSGFSVSWAIESNHECCETYRANFGEGILLEQDIRNVRAEMLSAVDVIAAGFPCQSFSLGGKQKGFQDARGNLFFEVIRFLKAHQPRFVFLENVANLAEHDEGRTFQIIYRSLVECGYYIRYRVMRASEYGNVPQIRDRIYIVAFKRPEDCDSFRFPEPIKLEKSIESVIDRTKKKREQYYYTDNSDFSEKAQRIVRDKRSIYRVYHDSIKPIRNCMCPTLTASMGGQRNQVPLVRDDYGVRKITPFECLEFQGFPPDFRFPKTITVNDAYRQVGNTVCVPVVHRISQKLKELR